MTQPFPTHPRVVETMAIVDHAIEQFDRLIEAQQNNSTTASDATKTVFVTVNHFRWLTDVWIAPGATRALNAQQMSARLREAVANANSLAQRSADAITADHEPQFKAVQDALHAVVAKYDPAAATTATATTATPAAADTAPPPAERW